MDAEGEREEDNRPVEPAWLAVEGMVEMGIARLRGEAKDTLARDGEAVVGREEEEAEEVVDEAVEGREERTSSPSPELSPGPSTRS